MKLPNNYGSVSRLSGNRRRPYIVRKSLNGKQMVIGYYDTKEKALQALAEYNRQPDELPKSNITLTTLYKQWLPHHAPTLSKSGVSSYENAYRHIQTIATIPLQKLTYDDFQGRYSTIPERKRTTVQLPILFNSKAFLPLISWDDSVQGANPDWNFVCGVNANTTSIIIGLHTQNSGGSRGVNWLVAGV